jgi:Spy/CpxP family protein refolding chaperone
MNRMRWSVGVVLAALVLGSGAAVGCAESNGQANAPGGAAGGALPADSVANPDNSPEAAELRAMHRHTHARGFVGFIFMSLDTLGVSPEQEAQIQKIKADMAVKMKPAHEAEAGLLNVLADGVAAGTIDTAKVDAATAKIAEVSVQVDDITADELNKLHAVLQGPQRAALADKVEAHWLIWQKANAEEENHPNQEQEGGHIHHMAQLLGLSADQVAKVDASFTASMKAMSAARSKFDPKSAEEHLHTFIQAFASEQFDAKSLQSWDKADSSIASWGASRMVRMYEAMTPVLTPEQKTKLAGILRNHATKLEGK